MPVVARCRTMVSKRVTSTTAACILLAGLASVAPAFGAEACHTSSDYDVTLDDRALQFERKTGPAQSIEMRHGALAVNQKPITLGADDKKRVVTYEARVRELVPRIKTIGQRGVDLMVAAIREEAVKASP